MPKKKVVVGTGTKIGRQQFKAMLRQQVKETTSTTTKHYAYLFRDYIRQVLEGQRYNWKPLSVDYAKYKAKYGLDPRILISTEEYKDSIKVFRTKDTGYLVGVPHKLHSESDLYLDDLAKIHEFGTETIPARPLWRTALSIFSRKYNK